MAFFRGFPRPQVAIEALHFFRGKAGAEHASCSGAALLRNLSEGQKTLFFSPNSVVNTWGSVTLVSLLFPLVLSTGCFAGFFWALKRNTADFTQDDR